MKKINLNGQWNLSGNGLEQDISAGVPGCVHTDLIKQGIIEDIFYRDNARAVQWIENCTWTYERNFFVDEIESGATLVFEGLDVYCDVFLNQTHLGYCENMFIPHSFSVDNILKKGDNTVRVVFYSPIEKVKDKPRLSAAFTAERLHTRRIQCTYGWDWVQRFVTFGIIKDAYVVFNNKQYCESAYIYTKSIDSFSAQICIEASFENPSGKPAKFEITHSGKLVFEKDIYVDRKSVKLYADIKNPVIWEIGKNNDLYRFTCTVEDEVLVEHFGIREAKILQLEDEPGSDSYNKCLELKATRSGQVYDKNNSFSSFELVLNSRRVMCKGANWVPCEPFVPNESDEKITRILELARQAHVNMIRVWGGGVFEKDHFYNECDRLGILVTQDFLMACGQYPENEDWFIENLSLEAKNAAKRLRNHPCLMWWSGDNENAVMGSDTDTNYQGRRSAHEGIAPVLAEYDHTRYFLPSSPYGGAPYASKTVGTTHNTQFLGVGLFDYMKKDDMSDYKDFFKEYDARFIAEEPCYGSADIDTLKRFMTDEDIYSDDLKMWYFHSKTGTAEELVNYILGLTRGILGDFKDGEDRLFKFRYIMYEWMRITLERARRSRGFCNGIVYWMLNDCWPAAGSWSMIDYYNKTKAGFYSFKRCADVMLLSFDKEKSDFYVYLCNDTDEEIEKEVKLMLVNTKTGECVKESRVKMRTPPQSSAKMLVNDMAPTDDTVAFAYADTRSAFYKTGDLKISKCDGVKITTHTDTELVLKAERYTHVVALEGGIFEDNWFYMQKGEERRIKITDKFRDVDLTCYTLDI